MTSGKSRRRRRRGTKSPIGVAYLEDLVVGVVQVDVIGGVGAQRYLEGRLGRYVLAHLVPVHDGVFEYHRGGGGGRVHGDDGVPAGRGGAATGWREINKSWRVVAVLLRDRRRGYTVRVRHGGRASLGGANCPYTHTRARVRSRFRDGGGGGWRVRVWRCSATNCPRVGQHAPHTVIKTRPTPRARPVAETRAPFAP